MVWAWNLVCKRFIKFKRGKNILTFGCPNNNTFSNTGDSFSFKRIIYLDICESIPEYFHFLNWSVVIKSDDNKQNNALGQEPPKFFARGPHNLLNNSLRAGHLTYCECFGICYILTNEENFCNYIIFSLLAKCLRERNEMASRAGFGSRAVDWKLLL